MALDPKTQRAALAPILWLNYALGLGVLELSKRPRYGLSITYNIICTTLYFVMLFETKGHDEENWIAYQEISYTFILWVNITVAIFSVILGFVNTEKLRNIIARCEQIDNTLEPFGVKKDYKKTFRYVLSATFSWSMLMLSLCAINTFWLITELNLERGTYLCILVHIPININSAVVLSFYIFMRIINHKLRKINMIMNEILQLPNVKNSNVKYGVQSYIVQKIIVTMDHHKRQRFILHFLQITRQVHLEIIRISRKLNQVYCYQLLLQLIVEFTLIMGALYNVYFEIMQSDIIQAFRNKVTFAMVLWIFVNSSKIIIINNLCTNLQRQAHVTAEVLRELGNSCVDHSIKDEIEQFSLQLILHPLYFSAGGFVSLNNQLTTMVCKNRYNITNEI
ncbi:hypothetical protein ANTPLA_LOCUS6909 [Anthophora plagiata]